MQKYTGEVIPFTKYEGEVIPFDDKDKEEIQADKARKTRLEEEVSLKTRQPERMEGSVKVGGDPSLSAVPSGGDEPLAPNAPALPESREPAGFGMDERAAQRERMQELSKPTSILRVPEMVGKGILNAGDEINVLGASLVDRANSQFGGNNTNYAGQYREALPKRTSENWDDQLLISGGEQLPGMFGGGKAGQLVAKGISGSGRLARAGKFGSVVAGQEIGSAMTGTKDEEGLLVGKNGKLSSGLEILPEDDQATKELKMTINKSYDNLLTVLAMGGAAKVITGAAGWAGVIRKNIKDWRKQPVIEREFAGDLLEIVKDLPADEAGRIAAMEEVAEKLENEGKKIYPMDNEISDGVVKKDTLSILKEGLDPKDGADRAKIIQLDSLRHSVKSSSPRFQDTLAQPERELHNKLGEIQEVKGGQEAMDQTRVNLQNKAITEAEAQQIPVDTAKQDLVDEQSNLRNSLRKDETFGEEYKKADEAGVSLDIHNSSLDKQTELLTKAKEARETNVERRNLAYDRVGETGALAKMDEFSDIYNKNRELLPKEIQDIVDNADGTFQYLNKNVRPAISKALDRAYPLAEKTGDFSSVDALTKLRDNITKDQMAHLTEQGSNRAAQAAIDATKENIEYSKLHNQGVGKRLKINEKINRPKGPGQDIDFKTEGRKIILNTISDPNQRESVKQLMKIVGPENEHLVPDIALAESFKEIVNSNDNIDAITKKLQDMSAAFPDQQKRRIEGFLTDVRDRKATIDDLRKRIPELEKIANQNTDEIYMGKFNKLFVKRFGKYQGVDNSYEAFKDILHSKNDFEIRDLLNEAKRNPDDLKGLQVAWAKAAKETLKMNKEDIVPFSEKFEKYGDEVFGENNKIIKSILELRDDAKKIKEANNSEQMKLWDKNKNQVAFHTAVNTVLTWAFGVLNPTSARIRTVTSDMAKKYNSINISHKAADNLLSDPAVAARRIREIIEKEKTKLSPEQRRVLFRFMVNTGLADVDDQTNEAFQK